MIDLLDSGQRFFTITTDHPSPDLFITNIKVVNLGLFFGDGPSSDKSRLSAFEQLYSTLTELVAFLDAFRHSINSPDSIPMLLVDHHKLLQVHILPTSKGTHQVTVNLIHLDYHNQTVAPEREALRMAYGHLAKYLKMFTEKIDWNGVGEWPEEASHVTQEDGGDQVKIKQEC